MKLVESLRTLDDLAFARLRSPRQSRARLVAMTIVSLGALAAFRSARGAGWFAFFAATAAAHLRWGAGAALQVPRTANAADEE